MRRRIGILATSMIAAIAMIGTTPVLGQAGIAEVQGQVVDEAGNPVPEAVVTFTNVTATDTVYSEKTNKKGRYFIPALMYYEPGDWNVTISAAGYVPRKISVESRTVNKTLVSQYETGIKPDQPHLVRIRPMGKATIDFTLVQEEALVEQLRQQQEQARAEQEAEALAQADPWDLARDSVSKGDLEGSLPHLQAAVEAEPAAAERYELYGKVLYNLERYDEALAKAELLLESAPDSPAGHLLIADVRARKGDFDGAHAELARASELAPQDVSVYKRMAAIADMQGDSAAAIEANNGIVELDPRNVEAWIALGGLYAEGGDLAASEAAFQKVVELDPENAYTTFFNIGALIARKDDPSPADDRRAVEAFRKATEIKPDYAKAHRELGYALLRTGDLAGARSALERYLELEPEAQDAGTIQAMVSGLPAS